VPNRAHLRPDAERAREPDRPPAAVQDGLQAAGRPSDSRMRTPHGARSSENALGWAA